MTDFVPQLKPAFHIVIDAEEGVPSFANHKGQQTYIGIKGGYTKTLDPEFPFDITISHGSDDLLTSNTSKNKATILDCKVYGTLNDEKKTPVQIKYSGLVHFQDKVAAIANNQVNSMDWLDGYATCHMNIDIAPGTSAEWVNDWNLVGRGRFFRDSNGGLHVEYIVSRIL
ncbi:hypothetical protein NADFUDRAFT_70779 [Nadsonia fulvescens var. elongata DSM 6958]|uniref:Uncharacterized protein n=1 Tax=Nadsonia fulvescens var. elongata DSM 6958 TaxID=857566 RepID=A0A1E3PJ11_9ASCO|nr:hypothetical protein NADFUDRAFT_70779 [Nadsonia fulvescens var. elongata DSM 6958]